MCKKEICALVYDRGVLDARKAEDAAKIARLDRRSSSSPFASYKIMDKVLITPLRAPERPRASFDYASAVSMIAAFSLVIFAIIFGGQLSSFLDLNSFLIVIGGTLGATLINYPIKELSRSIVALESSIRPNRAAAANRIRRIVELATRVRNEGPLALEEIVQQESDIFLRRCLQLLVDNTPLEELRRTLEIELLHSEDRHRRGAQIFRTMGAIAPAMGLIGSVIGLVQMLEHLDDPAKIGPGMATALLTTFYGAMLAYLIFIPLSGKLRANSEANLHIKEMSIEGVLCILQDLNPRLIEQRLFSFLPTEARVSQFE